MALRLGVSVFCVCVCVSLAQADMSYMTYEGVGLADAVVLHCAGSIADGQNVYAGQERVQYKNQELTVYCVDIHQWSASGNVVEQSYLTLARGKQVAYLLDTYGPEVTTNQQAAALGVAIWEAINETSNVLDATKGVFSITGDDAVARAANNLLATLPQSYQPPVDPMVLHSDTVQDFICPAPVPEPTTLAFLCGGALVLYRRAKRRQIL